jgi:hypothetical protein
MMGPQKHSVPRLQCAQVYRSIVSQGFGHVQMNLDADQPHGKKISRTGFGHGKIPLGSPNQHTERVRVTDTEIKGGLMSDTELEIAKRQVSELRVRLLQQQSIVLGLRREGGEKLQEATALLNSLMDELIDLEAKWDRLVNAS